VHATIFVVDKDPAFRSLARGALAQLGAVEEHASVREALEAADARPPQLVVTELVMDDLGAFELLRRYEERYEDRRTPFLVVSSLADDETLTQCLDAGADDFVRKPVSANVLRARAAALLRRSGSLDRRALLGPGAKRSVRLSRVLVNGHELVIETRFVPAPKPEIQTCVLAGERKVMCTSLPVPAELDSAEVDVIGLRAHARAEAEMRDRVTALREQHQRAREGVFAKQDDVQRLFDEGIGHALHAQWRDALACWERALELDPANAALRCNVEVARRKLDASA
jgi:DNA-binding response OmpR family regulator